MAKQSGLRAMLTIGTYAGAELEHVQIEVDNELIEVTDLADHIAQAVPGAGTWTVLGRTRYAYTPHFLGMALAASGSQASVAVTVLDPNGLTVLTGTGYVAKAGLTFPRGAAGQEVTVRLNEVAAVG